LSRIISTLTGCIAINISIFLHSIDYFKEEPFQAIDCDGTDNLTHNNQDRIQIKPKKLAQCKKKPRKTMVGK